MSNVPSGDTPDKGGHNQRQRHHQRAAALGVPVLPLIPWDGILSATTRARLEDRGKCPGLINWTTREWSARGVAELDELRRAQPGAVVEWDDSGAAVGIACGERAAFDCDATDEAIGLAAFDWLERWLVDKGLWPAGTPLPHRVGRPPKWLVPFRVTGALSPSWDARFLDDIGQRHTIQWLGRGKQFVACGTHPGTGQPYRWHNLPGGAAVPWESREVCEQTFVPIEAAAIQELRGGLLDWLGSQGYHTRATALSAGGLGGNGGVDPETRAALAGPSVDIVVGVMRALPNRASQFLGRQEWVDMAQALRGALPDHPDEAREAFVEWSSRWDGGMQAQDPAAEFDKTAESVRLGWPFIYDKAREAGVPMAGIDFGQGVGAESFGPGTRLGNLIEQIEHQARLAAARALDKPDKGSGALPPGSIGPTIGVAQPPLPAGLIPAPALKLPPDFRMRRLSGERGRAMKLGPRPYLYGRYYARQMLSLLVGRGGVSKTGLALVEALAMALGRELLGEPIYEVGLAVGHVNLDENEDELLRRARAILERHGVEWDDTRDVLLLGADSMGSMSAVLRLTETDDKGRVRIRQEGLDAIARLIEQNCLDLLQLDPLGPLISDANNNDLVWEVTQRLGRVMADTGAGLGLTHHYRKLTGEADAAGADDIKGASALVQAARYARTLRPMNDKEAASLGVGADVAWRHIRIDDAKANHSAPLGRASWFHLDTVDLRNGSGLRPADMVGVPVLWTPPTYALTPGRLVDLLEAIERGPGPGRRYTASKQSSGPRSAITLAETITGAPRLRAGEMLDELIGQGVLIEDEYHDAEQRRKQKGLRVADGAISEARDANRGLDGG